MSTDLVIDRTLAPVDPETGELLDTPAAVGAFLSWWGEYRRDNDKLARHLKDLVLAGMDEQAQWTIRSGGFIFEGASPQTAKLDWDMDELEKLLDADPPLPPAVWDRLVQPQVTYKVSKAEANRIASANEAWAAILARAERRKPSSRNVSAKPVSP